MDVIQDYEVRIGQFEELLQRITTEIVSNVLLEKMSPSEVWSRSQKDIISLRDLTERLKGLMLLLKPERAATIKRRAEATLKPLKAFEDILLGEAEGIPADSKRALEELRKATSEASELLELAKEIRDEPSEGISMLLRLKEVYDAKDYLSAVSIPEAMYIRLEGLKREIGNLKTSIANIEQALSELKRNLETILDEISKFRPLRKEEKKAGS